MASKSRMYVFFFCFPLLFSCFLVTMSRAACVELHILFHMGVFNSAFTLYYTTNWLSINVFK